MRKYLWVQFCECLVKIATALSKFTSAMTMACAEDNFCYACPHCLALSLVLPPPKRYFLSLGQVYNIHAPYVAEHSLLFPGF